MTDEDLTELMHKHCVQLSEHFGAVRIFATRVDDDGKSNAYSTNEGDWYSTKAAIDDWVMEQNAATKHRAIKEDE